MGSRGGKADGCCDWRDVPLPLRFFSCLISADPRWIRLSWSTVDAPQRSNQPLSTNAPTCVQMLFVKAPQGLRVFNGNQLAGDTCNPLVSHPPHHIQPSILQQGLVGNVWGAHGELEGEPSRCV